MSKSFNVILFEDYTPLDVFGPVEVFSRLPESIKINFYSENGGAIKGGGNTQVETLPFFALRKSDILLIPGGWGIRREINKTSLKQQITEFALASEYVLAVCTGAALLAKCGVLDGLKATCNKLAFDWVQQQGEKVHWVNTVRWLKDVKFYTSSGIMSSIDMSLGFISDYYDTSTADEIAERMEYTWNKDRLIPHPRYPLIH